AERRRPLELGAEVGPVQLLLELEGDEVTDRIVRQIEEIRHHVRIDGEKAGALPAQHRRVALVPEIAGDAQGGLAQLRRRRLRVRVHVSPDAEVDETDAGDLPGAPEIIENAKALRLRVWFGEAEQFEV